MITYEKGDLFAATEQKDFYDTDSILLHACNCKGVWGSGIAVEFKKKYPFAFERYYAYCQYADSALGTGVVFSNTSHAGSSKRNTRIGCLFTSRDYGYKKDPLVKILSATYIATQDLISRFKPDTTLNIHSPKINSGRFAVPWEKTEEVILKVLRETTLKVNWTVWVP